MVNAAENECCQAARVTLRQRLGLSKYGRVDRLYWLPISIIRPEELQEVSACNAVTQRDYGVATYRAGMFLDRTGHVIAAEDVTHWMARPKLPLPP